MDLFKKRGLNLKDAIDKRNLRLRRRTIEQKAARNNAINARRNLGENVQQMEQEAPVTVVNMRQQMLNKWKEEKKLKKLLEAEKKKPAFKICKIQYEIPQFLNSKTKPEKVGVVTRGMAKAALSTISPFISIPVAAQKSKIPVAKIDTKNKAAVMKPNSKHKPDMVKDALLKTKSASGEVVIKATQKVSPKNKNATKVSPKNKCATQVSPKDKVVTQVSPKDETSKPEMAVKARKSFAPENFKFEAPPNLANYNFGQTPFESQSAHSTMNNGAVVSEISSEPQQITSITPETVIVSTAVAANDTVSQTSNVENNAPSKTVEYFKDLLSSTIDSLNSKKNKWVTISENNEDNRVTDNVIGLIRTTVGQTDLMINKKFKQFAGLISDCENKTGERETLIDDLQGFWDMMFFQVEDLQRKFDKLEKIMNNDWVEIISPVKRFKPAKNKCVSKVRVNKAQEARLRVAKTKALAAIENVFSPIKSLNTENQLSPEMKEPLLRISMLPPLLQQRNQNQENVIVDKLALASLFSPIKVGNDRCSIMNKDESLIRFSDVHSLGNKVNMI